MRLIALISALILPHAINSAVTGGGKVLGVPTAPVMIEVYSDFQCPACKTLHDQTLRPLVVDYVRSGKVYLVHREFPLTGHAYARQAAYLACAAERIGKYSQVADAIFANQAAWSLNGKVEEAALRVLTPAEATKLRVLTKDSGVIAEVERAVVGKRPLLEMVMATALAGGGTNFGVANSGYGRSDLFQAGAFVRHNVGTAYIAPEPGAKPFIEVGSKVKAGDTLLIVEAMKTMNQIPAPHGGTVIQILFEER